MRAKRLRATTDFLGATGAPDTLMRVAAVENVSVSPRDFSNEPAGFGRVRRVQWRAVDREDRAALLAAQLQHMYAIRIRDGITRPNTLKKYARDAGTSYDRLGKILRGVVVMRLEDIAIAEILIGGVIEPNPK
jgi:hypothetical protein